MMNRHGGWLLATAACMALGSATLAAQDQSASQTHRHGADATAAKAEASGTSWLPDATPLDAAHLQAGDWTLMLHGNAFVQFLLESGEFHHAGHQFGSINWIMGMATRRAGVGRVTVRTMFSLEPWTIPGCGYPDLLATGEVCNGDTIHDRQHPHELFMEISVLYDRPIRGGVRWQIYGGPSGEPALGPTGFPHRPSAAPNPLAPIAHHWLDATHVTFGVVTTGIYSSKWKVDGSVFNGREPDERRTDFDLGPLDSVAARLSFAPNQRLVFQTSAGHLKQAEAGVGQLPRTDVNHLTASAIYHRPLGANRWWATTAAYGMKWERAIVPGALVDQRTDALLLETSAEVRDQDTWFGRFELVGKPAHDLHALEFIPRVFPLAKLEAGYVRTLKTWNGLEPGLGAVGMLSIVPELLAPRYGGRVAPGFGVFLRVKPRRATTTPP